MSAEIKKKLLIVSLAISILYSLFYAMPLYMNSTFLESIWGREITSIIYTASALISLFLSFKMVKYIKKIHTYNFARIILIFGFISTISMGLTNNPFVVAFGFLGYFITQTLFWSIINILVEEFTAEDREGEIKGIFLTLVNAGILISPLIAGQVMSVLGYQYVYILSALMLIPILIVMKHYYHHIEDPKYTNLDIRKTIKEIRANKNISLVLLSTFILNTFYAVMTIYAPLYLIANTNISIDQYVGVIMPFALIPFVLLPYQLGYLADKKYGEKEMMISGIVIIALTSLLFPFLNTNNIFFISLFLLISRVGATMLETMNYTYFYRKVSAEKVSLVVMFSNMSTMSYVAAPLLASIILQFSDGRTMYIFITFAILALLSLNTISRLKDTR
ncbi:MAG: hypothetical protein QG614_454 [Patescibacteria group bacterium]|nr:hypothetical protein [Patescibacteria group bacterium]